MRQIIDKYNLYVLHLQNIIAGMSKKVNRATVKGKLKKPKILCCTFLTDILTPAKVFSLKCKNVMLLL